MRPVDERPDHRDPVAGHRGGHHAELDAPAQRGAWSGLAVAASLALVAFAVLFGVYGPPLGNRGNPSLGTSLFELADVTRSVHDELVFEAIHAMGKETPQTDGTGPSESGPTASEVSAAASRIVGFPLRVPDLSAHGFRALAPRATRVPGTPGGASAVNVVYVRGGAGSRDFVTLTLIPDDEQFIVYDEFGRPRFVPINRPVSIDVSSDGFGRNLALAWTDGRTVTVAHASRPEFLDEVYDTLMRTDVREAEADNPDAEPESPDEEPEAGPP
jgi:hypothetical protein